MCPTSATVSGPSPQVATTLPAESMSASKPARRSRETSNDAIASSWPLGLGTDSIAVSSSATSTLVPVTTPVPIAASGSDRDRHAADDLAHVVGNPAGDVHAGHVDGVLELHGRVDLAHQ